MSLSILAGSETSTQRSTSFDDISSDGTNYGPTSHAPSSPVQDLGHHGRTYGNQYHSAAEIQHQLLRDLRDHQPLPLLEPLRPIVPPRRCRMNMAVVVDLEALLPDGIQDFSTGQPVVNLDSVHIFTFTSYTQLQDLTVDYIKWAIQDLSWECLGLPLRKRDFKLWLQVRPPALPLYPYGQYEPLDYDNHWIEVLNTHQIPFGQDQIHLRAHHPESIFDWHISSSDTIVIFLFLILPRVGGKSECILWFLLLHHCYIMNLFSWLKDFLAIHFTYCWCVIHQETGLGFWCLLFCIIYLLSFVWLLWVHWALGNTSSTLDLPALILPWHTMN